MDEHDLRDALTWLAGRAPDTGGLTEQVDRRVRLLRIRHRRYALTGAAAAVVAIAGTIGGLTRLGGSAPAPATGPSVISSRSTAPSPAASATESPDRSTWTVGTSPSVTGPTASPSPGTTTSQVAAVPTAGTGSASTPRTAPPVVDSVHPATCTAANGASWRTTPVTAPGASSGGTAEELHLLGVDRRGGVVAIEQTAPNRVVRIVAGGVATDVRDLYTAPTDIAGQGQIRLGAGMVDGDWAVFSIVTGGGQGAASGIEAVDTATGAVRDVRDASLGSRLIVSPPILVDGVVYWGEVSAVGDGHIYAYDLATATRRTLASGSYADPFTVGGGVYWFGPAPKQVVTYRRGALPPGYVVDNTDRNPTSVLGNGELLVWNQGTHILARNGSGPTVTVAAGSLAAVTDGYIVYSDDAGVIQVLDLRTGATLGFPQAVPLWPPAAAGAGTLALNTPGAHGGSGLALADVQALPRLHC